MFNDLWEEMKENFINMITSRLFVLILVLLGVGSYLIYTIFNLQIIHGEEYANNFQLKITKERTIPATRGNILDRNGKLLAYNELAYSVTIEDVFESGKDKNAELNDTILKLIKLIEKNGDHIVSDFHIVLNRNDQYEFDVEGTQLLRFLADIYGHVSIDDLKQREKTSSAEEVINYLCGVSPTNRYGIGDYTNDKDKKSFTPGFGFTKEEVLKLVTIRYAMSANNYQKYIATTVANNVSEKTVAVVMENADQLEGVSIAEGTIRKYNDSIFFSQLLGYTGKVAQEELKDLQEKNALYDLNDTVGKSGIEASMEMQLQGVKGSETVYVNNLGKVIETSDKVDPQAGNDVYLTVDADLQKACYHIIESKLASILLAKIQNIKEYHRNENSSSADIIIPIYDVYFACINNNLINTEHFSSQFAGDTEKAVLNAFISKKEYVLDRIHEELTAKQTPYERLATEYQVYESFITSMLYNANVIDSSLIDKEDPTYIAWTKDETISLYEYINYTISQNWVDVTQLQMSSQYSDSKEIYNCIVDYILDKLSNDKSFDKKIYRYMINNDEITGKQICNLLLEQDIVEPDESEIRAFHAGSETSYEFMIKRIEHLDITPAQLALDPYSGSIVITDINTGDVLALVSYPSYDNNRMANGVDAAYYARLRDDLAYPLLNYATQQKTAPGSTFKIVSATTGLMEGTITTNDTITCTGVFEKISPAAKCWIAPGAHGSLNVTGGIEHSCNWFFYEVGYMLGQTGESYNSDLGLKKLAKYADLYGLSETSGVEIEEYTPDVSDTDAVRSAIGHGTNNYTTVGLARYVTTIANSGTCYNLTLIDKIDNQGRISDNTAEVRNRIDMNSNFWNAIHTGMRRVVENKAYYKDINVNVAGKTGTAQENKNRPNHALFISYAPYENPEISVTVRVANGYTSDYAAQIAKDVYAYYYGEKEDKDEIITSGASADHLATGTINGD